ncbi:hypothetical protein NA57DRAFT_55153 [Rhizodiscina lignyota]|uniref:Heterokaryon incompatibility domain-containing protein n=1 Tax=Rhizodiscina lignyota TaxID=1504668 RepID=A0A9P4IGD1_9PEZI|nr:hypothetical protein NA57DRAFT_55153 [Rhizodiscina lignyota]
MSGYRFTYSWQNNSPPVNRPLTPPDLTEWAPDPRLQKIGLANKPAAEFDNFYTPQNQSFYSKSPYLPLDPKRREIRLVKVLGRKPWAEYVTANPQRVQNGLNGKFARPQERRLPSKKELSNPSSSLLMASNPSPMTCELVDKVALSRIDGHYCTLSYNAGKPTDTKTMIVDGIVFNAFANLEHAIGCAFESWSSRNPGRELLLWVDQICINQVDQLERGSQVAMMRDIYRRSNETFICLSTPGAEHCLSWVPRVPRRVSSGRPSTQSIGPREEWPAVSALKMCLRRLLVGPDASISPPIAQRRLQDTSHRRDTSRHRDTSNHENAARRRATSKHRYSSSSSVSSPEPSPPPVDKNLRRHNKTQPTKPVATEHSDLLAPKNGVGKTKSAVDEWVAGSPRPQGVAVRVKVAPMRPNTVSAEQETSLSRPETVSLHGNTAISNEVTADRLLTGLEAFTTSQWWGRSWVYQEFIASPRPHFLSGSTSIPWTELAPTLEFICGGLDAFIDPMLSEAITSASQEDKQKNKDAQEEYQRSLREYEEKMNIYQQQSLLELRKWWQARQISSLLTYGTGSFKEAKREWENDVRNGSGEGRILTRGFKPSCSRPKPPVQQPLAVAGKQRAQHLSSLQNRFRALSTSTISSMVEGKVNLRRSSDLKTILQHSRHCKASDPRDRVYAFIGLADKEYAIIPDYSTSNTVVQVLINTARRIIEHEKKLSILKHVCHGREKLGWLLPSWVPDWTSTEVDRRIKDSDLVWSGGQRERSFDASKGLVTRPEFRKDETNESNMDLKTKGVFFDFLDEYYEADEPDGAEDAFPHFQSFLTQSSRRVIAPKSALLDDEVWVLHGASKPVLLRPEGDDTYGFLGEILVCERNGTFSDVMFGKMIELAEQGNAETKDIWIV